MAPELAISLQLEYAVCEDPTILRRRISFIAEKESLRRLRQPSLVPI
jgi:hypothetical protein